MKRYRESLRIQEIRADATEDAHGDIDERDDANWRNVVRIMGDVEETGGREYQQANQQQADVTHRVEVRDCQQLRDANPRMRILWRERVLNVVRANWRGRRRRFIEFECRARR